MCFGQLRLPASGPTPELVPLGEPLTDAPVRGLAHSLLVCAPPPLPPLAGDQSPELMYRLLHGEGPEGMRTKVGVLLIGTNDLGFALDKVRASAPFSVFTYDHLRHLLFTYEHLHHASWQPGLSPLCLCSFWCKKPAHKACTLMPCVWFNVCTVVICLCHVLPAALKAHASVPPSSGPNAGATCEYDADWGLYIVLRS